MNKRLLNVALWVIVVLVLVALLALFSDPHPKTAANTISLSQLLTAADEGRVSSVVIRGQDIHASFANGPLFQAYAPNDPAIALRLHDKGVRVWFEPGADNVPWFISLFVTWLPFIALIGVWIFLSRNFKSGGILVPTSAEHDELKRQVEDLKKRLDEKEKG